MLSSVASAELSVRSEMVPGHGHIVYVCLGPRRRLRARVMLAPQGLRVESICLEQPFYCPRHFTDNDEAVFAAALLKRTAEVRSLIDAAGTQNG